MGDPRSPRTALVTGANRGIGLALAENLQQRGWSVVGTARNPDDATELAATGARVEALDHTDPASVAALARSLGDLTLDLLVLNAGILAEDRLEGLDPASVLEQLDSNAVGPLRVVLALVPHLRRGERSAVAALSSVMGSVERNREGGYYGYRASKAALNAVLRSLHHDLDLPVVAFHPGYVRTGMTGGMGNLTPDQAARSLVEHFEAIGPGDSGRFLDPDGKDIPW